MQLNKCSCGEVCAWMETAAGKWLLVDLGPDGDLPEGERFDPKVHCAHWATCPDAEKYRAKREPAAGKTRRATVQPARSTKPDDGTTPTPPTRTA